MLTFQYNFKKNLGNYKSLKIILLPNLKKKLLFVGNTMLLLLYGIYS